MHTFPRTGMLIVMLSALLVVLVMPGPRAVADAVHPDLSKVRVLAISPFYDEMYVTALLLAWGPPRLVELMGRTPYRIVSSSEVAAAMKRLGLVPRDLIGLTNTVEVGRAVGADAVLTSHITYALQDNDKENATLAVGRGGSTGAARVDMDVRILDITTRLKFLQEQFSCTVPGPIQAALDCVVHDVALRVVPAP